MANLNVTYQDLRDASGRLHSGQDDIDGRLLELKGFIDNLVASGYVTSASSAAFQEQYAQFTESARTTVGALQGLRQFLVSAAEALEQTDLSLANSVRGQ